MVRQPESSSCHEEYTDHARQGIQPPRLNPMHQLPRRPLRRNKIKPPPSHQQILTQPQNPISQRITIVMVIKQPPIQPLLPQSSLNRVKVHTEFPVELGGVGEVHAAFLMESRTLVPVR